MDDFIQRLLLPKKITWGEVIAVFILEVLIITILIIGIADGK